MSRETIGGKIAFLKVFSKPLLDFERKFFGHLYSDKTAFCVSRGTFGNIFPKENFIIFRTLIESFSYFEQRMFGMVAKLQSKCPFL